MQKHYKNTPYLRRPKSVVNNTKSVGNRISDGISVVRVASKNIPSERGTFTTDFPSLIRLRRNLRRNIKRQTQGFWRRISPSEMGTFTTDVSVVNIGLVPTEIPSEIWTNLRRNCPSEICSNNSFQSVGNLIFYFLKMKKHTICIRIGLWSFNLQMLYM